MTSFAYTRGGFLERILGLVPVGLKEELDLQLRRRSVSTLPGELVASRPLWEIIRTIADRAGASAPIVDLIWDHLSHEFTRAAGRRLSATDVGAVYAYEYSALEAFNVAERLGKAKILDFPSLNSREFEELQREEKARFPELKGRYENYFAERFERRQARRDAEMAAADVIITNSSVSRRSHIAGGADPERTFSVPYGAPPVVGELADRRSDGQLRVVWAGTFSIRKGAHYFLDAWRELHGSGQAQVDVYGAVTLPERLWKPLPDGVKFHGSVPRDVLFNALDEADLLMFPTLSDGFGMVVTEAFSRGLPVITTEKAGASDLVSNETNGLVIPAGSAPAIREALLWCLENRKLLAAMRHEAWKTAKNWQWSDYRGALISAVVEGLNRAGYAPGFEVLER
ncbi:MAG: glycosyltransferase family 4 protein [Beijerinckiaceae bacterium]